MAVQAWRYFTTQVEWKRYLQDLLESNDAVVVKAILAVDSYQTEPERQAKESVEDNNVGWTKHDAKEMGELADKIRAGEQLSVGEMAKSRNKMKKYWRQLMLVSKRQMEAEQKKAEEFAHQQQKIIDQQVLRVFRENIRAMIECSEKGKPCDYGICDECPVTRGLQLRLMLGGTDDQI